MAQSARAFDIKTLFVLLVIFVSALLFWNTPFVWPLKILVVFFHEISHGLAALLTGGSLGHIEIGPDEGGLAWTSGGIRFIVLSAGYLGSLVFGCVLLLVAARTDWDKIAVALLGATILFVTFRYVPLSNHFGFAFGLITGGVLLPTAKWAPLAVNDFLLKTIGITSCGYAIIDIYDDVIARSNLRSDARMLSEITPIPTVVWGVLWIALACAVTYWMLRLSVNRSPRA
jgi:hypothetical protein